MELNSTNIATVLRLLMGWFMFFAGLEKVTDPTWTAAGFLTMAKTFPAFYAWLAEPYNIWWVNSLNEWSIFLIGVALLLGIFVRPAAWGGAALMILYYFPQVDFPIVPHGYFVDEHIFYTFIFILIACTETKYCLSEKLKKTKFAKIPYIGKYI